MPLNWACGRHLEETFGPRWTTEWQPCDVDELRGAVNHRRFMRVFGMGWMVERHTVEALTTRQQLWIAQRADDPPEVDPEDFIADMEGETW